MINYDLTIWIMDEIMGSSLRSLYFYFFVPGLLIEGFYFFCVFWVYWWKSWWSDAEAIFWGILEDFEQESLAVVLVRWQQSYLISGRHVSQQLHETLLFLFLCMSWRTKKRHRVSPTEAAILCTQPSPKSALYRHHLESCPQPTPEVQLVYWRIKTTFKRTKHAEYIDSSINSTVDL